MADRVFPGLLLSLVAALAAHGVLGSVFAGTNPETRAWERVGPPGGMVISMAAAADGTVYLGTPDGHIFASANRGERWEVRGRAGGRLDGVVQELIPDARDAKRLLAAVWFREAADGGVFESGDGARNWKPAGLGDEAVRALVQSASDPKVWVAGTRRGVFRSDDDARSWQRITSADDPELQTVDSLAIDPVDPRTIYVGTYHLPWKTTDGGKTWKAISAGMIDDSDVMSLRIDARDPKRIFSSACSGIYRSDDSGASWIKLQGIPYSSRRTQQIVQDPADYKTWYAATTEGLWTTSDYGETWKRITGRETNANAVLVMPDGTGKRVLAGMDAQGVLRSDDGGNSFVPSNGGFSHRVILSIAADLHDPDLLLVRAEGYGTLLRSEDGGRNWRNVPATPSGKTVDRVFASAGGWWVTFFEGGLARLDAGGGSWRLSSFRETVPRPATARRGRAVVRNVNSRVSLVIEAAGRAFVATDRGFWQSGESNTEFRRATGRKVPAQPVSYLAADGAGALYAIAGGEVWSDSLGNWNRIALDTAKSGAPLWVAEDEQDKQLVIGTPHGVLVGRANGMWRLAANGLPSIGSVAPAFSGERCLISMDNGSLYMSSDGLKTWRRIEADAERGRVGAVLTVRQGRFLIASEQEGILVERDQNEN